MRVAHPVSETSLGLAASFIVIALALRNVLPMRRGNVFSICCVAAVWYWTSALWAAVTKDILSQLPGPIYPSTSIWLTFLPQALSYFLVQIFAWLAGLNLFEGTCVSSKSGLSMGIWQLAGAAYFFGQLFTVAALALDAPSIIFVVKAIEPLSTALLAVPLLKQSFNLRLFMAILVACTGIMITAWAAHGGMERAHQSHVYLAMALGMLANVGFSSRACVAKRALAFESSEPLEAYGKLTLAATQSGSVLLLLWLLLGHAVLGDAAVDGVLRHLLTRPGPWFVASFTYFLYQSASILLLSCFLVETHALLVALKHVFVVVLASLMTGAVLNSEMVAGLAIVCAGVAWYLSGGKPEKDAVLPCKMPAEDLTVPWALVALVITVVAIGTVMPMWRV